MKNMKKLIAMMLMLASVFFIACDDDEEDKKPLTADEAKVEITQAISDMSTHIDALNNAEGKLVLARVTEKVNSLLMITQLIKVFQTYETVERAVASLE